LDLSPRTLIHAAIDDFRRTWPQLVVTDLLARVLAVVIVSPVVGLLIKLFLRRTKEGVVTDEAIVSFMLHPFGLMAAIVVGAVSLGMLFAESGQLMVIAYGAAEHRRVTWLDALRYTYRRAVQLIRLAAEALVRLLLIAAPFLAAIAGIYWLLVRTHDINFYLARRPPEFVAAVGGAGLLAAGLALIVAWKIAGWILAVPMVLFENASGRASLASSFSLVLPRRRAVTAWLLGWVAASTLLSIVVTQVVGLLGRLTVAQLGSQITALLAGLGVVILVGGAANLAVSVLTTVFFPLLVVGLYRSIAGPGELRPEIAPSGSLGARPVLRVPGKTLLAVVAVVLLAVVTGMAVFVDEPGWRDPTEIIAHRGGAWNAPENSMAAFERAIADGTDWIELDVQENADGTVIVEHDRDFMRAAGVPLDVSQSTDADLANLDIGSAHGPQFAGERVPTLREALDLASGRAGVFIELKYYGREVKLEERVVAVVEAAGMADQIVIMSLKYEGVRTTARLRPEWTYGLLNAVAIGDLTRLEADFLAPAAGTASTSMIRRTQRRGMKIYPWCINDPVQMWVMMSRGADGIITDRVVLANRIKELRAEATPVGRLVVWMAAEVGLLQGIGERSAVEDA
jgi:glycerophosphoryl diester phosphodiesterase